MPATNDRSSSPASPIRSFSLRDFDALSAKAVSAERQRAHQNLHATPEAAVQRLFIATEPSTYMRPHRHPEGHKWEFFVVLRGRLDLLIFSAEGELLQRLTLAPGSTPAAEIPPGTFHAYVCMQSGTIGLEVKEGAYLPTPEHDFAPWAPPERSPGAAAFVEWMRGAQPPARAPRGGHAAFLEEG